MTLADAVPLPPTEPRRPRRRAAAIAGIVGVAAVVGGGAWAWQVWAAQGPQPAEALPADTLAYVAVDLDPPGGQKVAAYRALKRIPSLAKELGIGSQDDLRKSLVESIAEDGGCDLPWREVEDWAGDRGALAVVPLEEPALVVALQVSDPDGARRGLAKVADSCGDDEFGFTVGDGWAILAETDEIAEQVRADAKDADLAGDQDFKELTGATGDPGVVTLYAAPEAGQALLDVNEEFPFLAFAAYSPLSSLDPVSALITSATFLSEFSEVIDVEAGGGEVEMPEMSPEEEALWGRMDNYDELTRAEQKELDKELADFYEEKYGEDQPLDAESSDEESFDEESLDDEFEAMFEIPEETRKALEDFSGLGGSARFDHGGVELEVVGDPFLTGYEGMYDGTAARDALAVLPADTVVAFGAGFADGWAERAITRGSLLSFDSSEADLISSFEDATGLTPGDLEALGGDTVAFAAKAGFEKAIDHGPAKDVTIAARVTGDPAKIEAALAKVAAKKNVADFASSVRTDDGVVIGPNPSYLAELVDPDETLGGSDGFEDAVSDAKDALAIAYVDLGAGHWLRDLVGGEVEAADVDALSTFAMSVVAEGDQYRYVARLAFE
ncbi:hypothetical protein [Nocardioides aromaticivorans]|uniref:hypothetical protein n=1 Tax=Nocardioides aromaticivorans TaxID=200618 RepID=UPI001A8DE51D|nr:hypothetical protein [Nocardioides aromaticivorans]